MKISAPNRYSFAENKELRAQNRARVTDWFSVNFAAETSSDHSAAGYQPYVRYQRNFLPEGRREYVGLDAVTAQLQEESARVTDWEWTDLEILASDYPQIVWAFAEASYEVVVTGERSANSYAFAFVLEDGKIRMIKAWVNPLVLLAERGVEIPSAHDL